MERMLAHPDGGWQPLGTVVQHGSLCTGRGFQSRIDGKSHRMLACRASCYMNEHSCADIDGVLAAPMPSGIHPCRRLTSNYHRPRGLRRWRRAGGLVCGVPHGAHQVPAAGAQWRNATGEKAQPLLTIVLICRFDVVGKMHIAPGWLQL